MKIQCPKCGKKFQSRQALGMHNRWTHSDSGREHMMKAVKKGVKVRRINRADRIQPAKPKRSIPGIPSLGGSGLADRTTRPNGVLAQVNYCPQCRCNIRAVALALGYPGGAI